jgi:hypothetical protein
MSPTTRERLIKDGLLKPTMERYYFQPVGYYDRPLMLPSVVASLKARLIQAGLIRPRGARLSEAMGIRGRA